MWAIPSATWTVSTEAELFDALEDARERGGGAIFFAGVIEVHKTVKPPNRTALHNGGVIAAEGMRGHLVEIKDGVQVLMRNFEIDGNRQDVKGLVIWGDSSDIICTESEIYDCTTGITVSDTASHLTFEGVLSHHHTEFHGLAIREKPISNRSIRIVSSEFYQNAAYGLNLHADGVEVAGCKVYDNGQEDDYYGAAMKSQGGRNLHIHDTYFGSGAEEEGLTPIYVSRWSETGEVPVNVNIYRCQIRSRGRHINIREDAEVFLEQNDYRNWVGGETSLGLAGDGTKPKPKPELRELPDTVGKPGPAPEPDPEPEPPPAGGLTETDVVRIMHELFPDMLAAELGKIDVEITYEYG